MQDEPWVRSEADKSSLSLAEGGASMRQLTLKDLREIAHSGTLIGGRYKLVRDDHERGDVDRVWFREDGHGVFHVGLDVKTHRMVLLSGFRHCPTETGLEFVFDLPRSLGAQAQSSFRIEVVAGLTCVMVLSGNKQCISTFLRGVVLPTVCSKRKYMEGFYRTI